MSSSAILTSGFLYGGHPAGITGDAITAVRIGADLSITGSREGALGATPVLTGGNGDLVAIAGYTPWMTGVDGAGVVLWEINEEDALATALGSPPVYAQGTFDYNGRRYWTDLRYQDSYEHIGQLVSAQVTVNGLEDWQFAPYTPTDAIDTRTQAIAGDFLFVYTIYNSTTNRELTKVNLQTGEITMIVPNVTGFENPNVFGAAGLFIVTDASDQPRYACFNQYAYLAGYPVRFYDLDDPTTLLTSSWVPMGGTLPLQAGSTLFAPLEGGPVEAVTNAYASPAAWVSAGDVTPDLRMSDMGYWSLTNISFGAGPEPPDPSCFWTDKLRVEEDC